MSLFFREKSSSSALNLEGHPSSIFFRASSVLQQEESRVQLRYQETREIGWQINALRVATQGFEAAVAHNVWTVLQDHFEGSKERIGAAILRHRSVVTRGIRYCQHKSVANNYVSKHLPNKLTLPSKEECFEFNVMVLAQWVVNANGLCDQKISLESWRCFYCSLLFDSVRHFAFQPKTPSRIPDNIVADAKKIITWVKSTLHHSHDFKVRTTKDVVKLCKMYFDAACIANWICRGDWIK